MISEPASQDSPSFVKRRVTVSVVVVGGLMLVALLVTMSRARTEGDRPDADIDMSQCVKPVLASELSEMDVIGIVSRAFDMDFAYEADPNPCLDEDVILPEYYVHEGKSVVIDGDNYSSNSIGTSGPIEIDVINDDGERIARAPMRVSGSIYEFVIEVDDADAKIVEIEPLDEQPSDDDRQADLSLAE